MNPQPPRLHLGHRLPADPFADADPSVFYDAAELAVHRGRPWLQAHLRSRHGLVLESKDPRTRPGAVAESVAVPADLLDRHALVIGATGSGKTRLSLHLLTERLRAGGSALVLDFKRDTVRQALLCAERAGLARDQVTLLWTGDGARGVPGWNPFTGEASELRQRVRQFVGLVRASADVPGTRMWDLLTNAATVVAGQGLSIVELLRFLQSPDYMAGLLAQARGTPAWAELEEAHLYFELEFAALSKAERGSYVGPVLNKIRALVDIPYLKVMLSARRDTLDLPGLWQRQRLIAIHLDEDALEKEGVGLLAGMLAHTLYRLSTRKPGTTPVTLMLDELASQERYLGETIMQIVEKGRQQRLHLLCAGQHLEQISDGLRKLLLSSCALRVFFRLGPDDARSASRWLVAGAGSLPLRLALSLDSGGAQEEWRHDLLDPWGKQVALDGAGWQTFHAIQQSCYSDVGEEHRRIPALRLLLGERGVSRVYVRSPETGETQELGAYVKGLPASAYVIAGPTPLQLVVRFPRPKVTVMGTRSVSERADLIASALMTMPIQEAVVITDTGEKAQMRAVAVDFPDESDLPDVGRYLGQQEQTTEEVARTAQTRREAIEALSKGTPTQNAVPPRETGPVRQRSGAQAPFGAAAGPRRRQAGAQRMDTFPVVPALVAGGSAVAETTTAEPPAPRISRPEVADDGTI